MANRPYANEWDESIPESFDAFLQGDDRIRGVKIQIREIFEEDHVMNKDDGSGDTWGFHKQVTLMEQSGFPAEVTGAGIFFTKEKNSKAELYYMDNNNSSQQLTSGGTFIGGMLDEIRMWSGTLAELANLEGWELCEVPNLIGKFIHGISSTTTDPGTALGSNAITLTTANLPIHSHTVSSSGTHEHDYLLYKTYGGVTLRIDVGGGGFGGAVPATDPDTGTHTHTAASFGTGTNTLENRPSYYELASIK